MIVYIPMKKTIFVNLNFDDFHPEQGQYGDFGADPSKGTFLKLKNLCDQFPGLVITLFTSPNWIDRPYTMHRYFYYAKDKLGMYPVVSPQKGSPWLISKHSKWCNEVRSLVACKKFEIAVHGYEHFNPKTRIHGQEFVNLSESETKEKILLSESEFNKMNIPFFKGFRPPGWGTNKYLTAVLKELNYEMYGIASSRSKTLRVGIIDGLKTVPQNWSIRETKEEAIRLAEEGDTVFMKGHLTYKYGKETIENGITEEFWQNLVETLQVLKDRYDVKFVSLKEYLDIKSN
jgi:predicted deacetylase